VPEPQTSTVSVPVALLYQTGDLGGHLKTALNELGAAIVYESQASNLSREALEGSGARIVVFNLDPESEAQIDHVYDVLDAGDYEVVFNDADVSAQLSGWDQARWARHLAAKILHKPEIATPARPLWAESVPEPGQRSAPKPASKPAPAPAPPSAASPVELPGIFAQETRPPTPPGPSETAPIAASSADAPTLEMPGLAGFELEEIDVAAAESPAPVVSQTAADFASALDDFASHIPTHRLQTEHVDQFASELDALFADSGAGAKAAPNAPASEESIAQAASAEHIEFPAIFDHLDAAAAAVPEAAVDRSFKPAPLPGRAPPEPAKVDALANPLLPPEWSLEPLEEEPAGAPSKPLEKSSAFGIETMSATEFMGPEDAAVTPITPAGDAFSLELMPMEDAVAPQVYATPAEVAAAAKEDLPTAKFQVGAGTKLGRVFVLGASIGGPEAVREFLGALPAKFPALFVLAQHMGDEFLELMSMQLTKAVKLTVRTPTHGERIGHGEIVIVPTRNRIQIDDEGVIALSPLIERTSYSPSIDQVMRDVADQFGANAGAIIFSGMAQDAIEGSKYMASRGGSIWVQDPESCTISTMVDSVRQTGVVGFVGSPPQLAAKMLADYGKN